MNMEAPGVDPSTTVVHLTMRKGEIDLAVGSGVLYRRNGEVFLVTAWHNITGRHSYNLKPLHDHGALPDNVVCRVACHMSSSEYLGYTRIPFTVALEEGGRPTYFVHAQPWPRVDVAVVPIDPSRYYMTALEHPADSQVSYKMRMRSDAAKDALPGKPYFKIQQDIKCIQDFEQTGSPISADAAANLAVSDDIFVLGYPKGITDMYGQPIWKRATVATSPPLGWQRQKMFLVDCASREGMSGGPVISYTKGRLDNGRLIFVGTGPITLFHGVYTSRLGNVSAFEAQLGVVWKRDLVDEIIDGRICAKSTEEIEATPAEVCDVINDLWPLDTVDYWSKILEGKNYLDIFTIQVLEKLAGRADPDYVKDEVVTFARAKRSED